MALTDAGESYIAACKRILDDVRDAEHIVSGEYRTPRGELVISAPIVFGRLHVLPTITAFFKAYPEVTVRLVLSDRLVGLLEDHVDLALRIGELVDSTLIATRRVPTRRVVCGSPDYFSEHGTPKHPTDLASHAAVVFETSCAIECVGVRDGSVGSRRVDTAKADRHHVRSCDRRCKGRRGSHARAVVSN